ncbi:MAG: response regulator [Chloroflexi bacterium]|nr:response regulator [Chloroflexota bacterium]
MATKRILIVDDSDLIRRVGKMSLEKIGGWEVLGASSGSEGLARAEAEQPDAILLDVIMPEMDGPTTFRALQANSATRHIPVVFLTAKEDSADVRALTEQRATGLIAKPFDPMKLPGQVAAALGWSR